MSDEIKHAGPGEIHVAPPFTAPPMPPIPPSEALIAMLSRPIITPEQAETLRNLFAQLGEMARQALADLGPAMDRIRAAGLLPEDPPEDPKARALWMRQHRNTGPARPGPQYRRRTDQ